MPWDWHDNELRRRDEPPPPPSNGDAPLPLDGSFDDVEAVRALFPGLTLAKNKQGQKCTFLLNLAQCGQMHKAARLTGISTYTPYLWLETDPAFVEAVDKAKKLAAHQLESEAMRRALDGVTKGIWYKGERVGEQQEYSDLLTIFLLKGAWPDKYRENATVEHTLSPALLALQQQWSLAAQQVTPPALSAQQPPIEADYTVLPAATDDGREAAPMARTFDLLDAINQDETAAEPGEEDEDASVSDS